MARLSLLSEKPQYASNLIEENDPQALQIDENDLQALDAKARSFYQQGQFTEAFAIWRKIGQKAALEEAAEQALEQGQTNLAIQAYQTAYQIDPEGYPLCL